jgi:hypothetical protein
LRSNVSGVPLRRTERRTGGRGQRSERCFRGHRLAERDMAGKQRCQRRTEMTGHVVRTSAIGHERRAEARVKTEEVASKLRSSLGDADPRAPGMRPGTRLAEQTYPMRYTMSEVAKRGINARPRVVSSVVRGVSQDRCTHNGFARLR